MTTYLHLKDTFVGGIEAGGTKFKCVIGYNNGDIIAAKTFQTTNPTDTFAQAKAFFKEAIELFGEINALGIAHFGPVDIDTSSTNYGRILASTKKNWSDTDVVGYFAKAFNVPISFQSDVNGAAIGEHNLGNAQGIDNFVYITVGTGIGGGIFLAPLLHLTKWDTPKRIAATSSFFILVNSVAGLMGQIQNPNFEIEPKLTFVLLLTVLIGGQIGTRLSLKFLKPNTLKRFTAVLIAIVGIKLLFKYMF